jgi:hypothetical protein
VCLICVCCVWCCMHLAVSDRRQRPSSFLQVLEIRYLPPDESSLEFTKSNELELQHTTMMRSGKKKTGTVVCSDSIRAICCFSRSNRDRTSRAFASASALRRFSGRIPTPTHNRTQERRATRTGDRRARGSPSGGPSSSG